jgi:hypothetical protein
MSGSDGQNISVELGDRGVSEGSFVCVDPVTSMVVLKTGKHSFKMINPAFITNIEGILQSPSTDAYPLEGMDTSSLEKRESIALRNAEEGMTSLNFEVPIEVQNLFYRLQNM